MAPDHLLVDRRTYIVDGEIARIGSHLALKHHLQQNVAQLLANAFGIARFDGIGRLVRLFYQVLLERLVRLRAIPRAAFGSAQRCNRIDELVEVGMS